MILTEPFVSGIIDASKEGRLPMKSISVLFMVALFSLFTAFSQPAQAASKADIGLVIVLITNQDINANDRTDTGIMSEDNSCTHMKSADFMFDERASTLALLVGVDDVLSVDDCDESLLSRKGVAIVIVHNIDIGGTLYDVTDYEANGTVDAYFTTADGRIEPDQNLKQALDADFEQAILDGANYARWWGVGTTSSSNTTDDGVVTVGAGDQ